jgi:hypothetical protein
MSADGYGGCPVCVAQEMGKSPVDVTVDELAEYAESRHAMREYYEFFIDKGYVVAEYSTCCPQCNFSTSFIHKHPIL